MTSQTNIQISWKKFLEYLHDDGFYVCGTYKDTWEFIMDGNNSLNRYCSYCNVAVFFEQLENWVKLVKKKSVDFLPYSSIVKFFADPKNGTLGNK